MGNKPGAGDKKQGDKSRKLSEVNKEKDDDMVSEKSYREFNPQDEMNPRDSMVSKQDVDEKDEKEKEKENKDEVDIVNNENYWDYDTPFGEDDQAAKDKDQPKEEGPNEADKKKEEEAKAAADEKEKEKSKKNAQKPPSNKMGNNKKVPVVGFKPQRSDSPDAFK